MEKWDLRNGTVSLTSERQLQHELRMGEKQDRRKGLRSTLSTVPHTQTWTQSPRVALETGPWLCNSLQLLAQGYPGWGGGTAARR